MAEDSDLEKTEQPSQRRLDQAREKGQVARSRELSTFAVLLAGGSVLWFMGASFTRQMVKMLHDGLTLNRDMAFNTGLLIPRLYDLSLDMLFAFSPFLLAVLLAAAFSPLLLNGWLFSFEALQPKFSKLNPFSGIARMFSRTALVELAKAIGKAALVGGIAAWVIWHNKDAVMALGTQAATASIPQMGHLVGASFMMIVGAMLLIVAIDVPFQLWDHNKKLMMNKEDVRRWWWRKARICWHCASAKSPKKITYRFWKRRRWRARCTNIPIWANRFPRRCIPPLPKCWLMCINCAAMRNKVEHARGNRRIYRFRRSWILPDDRGQIYSFTRSLWERIMGRSASRTAGAARTAFPRGAWERYNAERGNDTTRSVGTIQGQERGVLLGHRASVLEPVFKRK